jgi:Tfp pilus assembly protein PilF
MIHFYMGRAYEGTGQTDRAAESYRKALEIAPDLAEARQALSRLDGSSR